MATLERIAIDYHALTLFCVDYYDKLSNFLEDVMILGGFAESIQLILSVFLAGIENNSYLCK